MKTNMFCTGYHPIGREFTSNISSFSIRALPERSSTTAKREIKVSSVVFHVLRRSCAG